MAIDTQKVTDFVSALNNKFENKVSNKKNDISGDFTNDAVSYPTVNAVKTLVANSVFSGDYDDLSNKPDLFDGQYSSLTGTPNLAAVATSGSYTDLEDKPILSAVAASGSYTDLSDKPKLFDGAYSSLTGAPNLANVATTGSYNDLVDTPDLDDLGGTVTVVKSAQAATGYAATYVIKQNNVQVGEAINIPKDYLVKSASVKTVTTADDPVTGYNVGDKYLEFIINTKDNSATNEPMYVNVKDLIDIYTADESTLTVANNQFKVKNGGIGETQLSSDVTTKLGYATDWNNSIAKAITANDIQTWNNKGTSNLTTQDVDDEIDAYLTAITTAL